jgi:F0F1-type ATP synthase assembly protein I
MNHKKELSVYLNLIIKIGSGVLSAILMGFALGVLLDKKFQLKGIGILCGVILGVATGFLWIYKQVMGIENNHEH